jgi:acetolactate synthase-1/2/3 large subunit
LIEALVAANVDTFFGIPGGPAVPVFDAILGTPGARLVESRHETSAAFEAAGYWLATGKVPAVVLTAGPGATNAVTGIASAHLERVPMLVICGDVAWSTGGGRLLQDSGPEGIDVERMLSKLVRASGRVASSRSAATQGLAILEAATNPANPGPALLVLPMQNGSATAPQVPTVARGVARHSRPPPIAAVHETARMLCDAERPLIVIGGACRTHASSLRRLLDAIDVPFVTTPRGKGVVSELHPRSLRHGGLAASMWARQYVQLGDGPDAVLVLGTDLDDCSVGPTPYVRRNGQLVHVDSNPEVFNRNLPTTHAIVADIGEFADALCDAVTASGLRNGRVGATIRSIKESSPFDQPGFRTDDSLVITPPRALADLEASAGANARFVTDIGEHMLFSLHYLTARDPDSFGIRLGLGSMGSGIASAIGLALGDPSRRVVCVCGDGGMQMVGMEALVAIREKLPILFAVFNDARYNMVYHGVKAVCGREAPWETPWVDFVGWGRALGMPGVRIHRPGEINKRLIDRLLLNGPAVLDIRIDRNMRLAGGGRVESLIQMSMGAERQ